MTRTLSILFSYFFLLLMGFQPTLTALECPFDIAISGGWRRDELKTLDIEPFVTCAHENTHIDITAMDVWQYGVKARSTLAGMLFYQEGFIPEHVYLRGSAFQGWIKNAHLHNHSIIGSDSSSAKNAFIHNGRTLDADIAVGFSIFPSNCWITLAPVGGYSFDKQKVVNYICKKTRVTYTTKWKGPFAGVDLSFDFCYFRFRAGYEYHWSYWCNNTSVRHRHHHHHHHSSSSSSSSNRSSSSSSSSSHSFNGSREPYFQGRGQVGYFDLRFYVCEGFDIGLGFRYQFWRTRKADHEFSDHRVFGRASWRSMGITGDLVFRF